MDYVDMLDAVREIRVQAYRTPDNYLDAIRRPLVVTQAHVEQRQRPVDGTAYVRMTYDVRHSKTGEIIGFVHEWVYDGDVTYTIRVPAVIVTAKEVS